MRTGDESQWTVLDVARVNMQSNSHKLIEQRCRRLHEVLTVFSRPRLQQRVLDSLLCRHGQVLVQRD